MVIKELLLFWNKARIPVRPEHHAVEQNAKRTSETQQAKIQVFVDQLGDLLDIAHQDALVLVKNP